MKILIILFLIISFPIKAEVVIETGKHEHLGKNYTKDESCKIAEEKAKLETLKRQEEVDNIVIIETDLETNEIKIINVHK